MHIERLQQLANGLRKINAGFNLDEYVYFVNEILPKEKFIEAMTNHNYEHCGAAGCAIGHFPVIFPDAWEYNGMPAGVISRGRRCGYVPQRIGQILSPAWRSDIWQAAMEFLQIDKETAEYLFELDQYLDDSDVIPAPTAQNVADRIEQLIYDYAHKTYL